jgi:predicted Zn-dependent protease
MGELYAFSRAQEQAADQAGMTFLDRLGWSGRGLQRLLGRMQEQEMLAVGRQDPYFRTHPLSRDRLNFVTDWVGRGRIRADAPFPPDLDAAFRMVRAKLDGFIDAPLTTWRRHPESDASAPARYARAVAQHRSGRPDAALGLLGGLVREQPANPWLRELQGQVLFEAGRVSEAVGPLREAARLAPGEPLVRLALGRALLEAGDPALLPAAAEEAMLVADFPGARMLARRAEEALPPGPLRLRAADLRHAAQRDNMTREQREQEKEMRRRPRP